MHQNLLSWILVNVKSEFVGTKLKAFYLEIFTQKGVFLPSRYMYIPIPSPQKGR